MKVCTKCKKEKELDDFAIKKTTSDGRAFVCKECQNEYTKEHYNNNKKRYHDRNVRRKKEARDYVIKVKKNSVCEKCGEKRWWVLDFHHVDNKKEVISKLLSHGIEIVKKEIKKCKILCANCHRDLHYQENNEMPL
jgi:hypothetical protein